MNRKSLGRSLLAVAAAAEYLFKYGVEALPLFRVKKQRRCRLSLVTKKSRGAAATATKKVAALEAPLCPSLYTTYTAMASKLEILLWPAVATMWLW